MHLAARYSQHYGLSMTGTYLGSGGGIAREMHMVATASFQTFSSNGFQEASGGSVIKDAWRFLRLIAELDLN